MDAQLLGATWIYQRILDYCEERANGIGGSYRQTSYKQDFFRIFTDALIGGFCGSLAARRYQRRCSRLKRSRPAYTDYVVVGEGIRAFLEERWLKGKNRTSSNERMVSDLCEWWDAWLFARGPYYPRDFCSPRRSMQRVTTSLDAWIRETNVPEAIEGRSRGLKRK